MPAAKAAYPSEPELTAFLTEAGFATGTTNIVALLDLTTAVQAGIDMFERAVGRTILAPAATSTRTFDPPLNQSSILPLGADLVSASSVTWRGVNQVSGTDYRLLPQDAAARGRPFDRMQFATRFYFPVFSSEWGTISVTGRWGYGTAIPDEAFNAMLVAGALSRLPQIAALLYQGIIGWSEADVKEDYGPEPLKGLRMQWESVYDRAVNQFRRVTVGV